MISLKRLFGLTPEQRTAKKNYNELMALTDRELNDMGIGRSEIRYIADEPVRELIKKENYEAGDHYLRGKKVSHATWKGKAHA